jgi:uncharacterized protein with HEPN domain
VRLCLPFRDANAHLQDIVEAIDHIDIFLGTMTFENYEADLKTKAAVERKMQIITEAAVRLGVEASLLCPSIDWDGFRGMGNILRHAYHRIDDKVVWDTVKEELPPMRKAVTETLGRKVDSD